MIWDQTTDELIRNQREDEERHYEWLRQVEKHQPHKPKDADDEYSID